MTRVPFNHPYTTGGEHDFIAQAIANAHLSSGGPFNDRCAQHLTRLTGASRVVMAHSCTGALELAALLLGVGPGDEVIMPSFTFASTANAFVLRGAVPVFVDVRPDTLNLDETQIAAAITRRTRAIVPVHYAGVACDMDVIGQLAADHDLWVIEDAVTPRTRAIVPVHYAGVACEMDAIGELARRRELVVVEDAAHSLTAAYRGRILGTIGDLGALSFHETKNVISGEGGALLVNDEALGERAEILRDKGTDRSRFLRGQVDRYTWVEPGSSFGMGELAAAFLCAQLEEAEEIVRRRLAIWDAYHAGLAELEQAGLLSRPVVPAHCTHDAHLYYVLLPPGTARDAVIADLEREGVNAVFHYVPLHSSPAGRRFGRSHGELPVTADISERLVRLPLWVGMSDADVGHVITSVGRVLARAR